MAFTAPTTVKALGKHLVRIRTGGVAGGGVSGIIGLAGDLGADVQLPSSFPSVADPDAVARGLDMTDIVEARIHPDDAGGAAAAHYHQVQQASPFRITITNDLANPTGGLDIYMHYHHSMSR